MALVRGKTLIYLAQEFLGQLTKRPTPILDALKERVERLMGQTETSQLERADMRLPASRRAFPPVICVEW